jgi:hypothetical protein
VKGENEREEDSRESFFYVSVNFHYANFPRFIPSLAAGSEQRQRRRNGDDETVTAICVNILLL